MTVLHMLNWILFLTLNYFYRVCYLFHKFITMIGTALWNIFRNINEQIFEEMKIFCLFKGVIDYCKQIEVSEFLHKYLKNFNHFGKIKFIFINLIITFTGCLLK